jgi:hypothetical protein
MHPAIPPESIGFPDEETLACEDGLVENHYYRDLRGYDASDFQRMWDDEYILLDYVNDGGDLASDEACEDELLVDNEVFMLDLDPGVASTVFALLAIGAVPVTSCNGEPGHSETHPLVLCWCDEAQLALIQKAASHVKGIQVTGVRQGILIWHESSVEAMRNFSRVLAPCWVCGSGPGEPCS